LGYACGAAEAWHKLTEVFWFFFSKKNKLAILALMRASFAPPRHSGLGHRSRGGQPRAERAGADQDGVDRFVRSNQFAGSDQAPEPAVQV
jgi:hypothetical protein